MRAKKLETAIRQEQIVQAALDLIGRQGLKKLSVARLARQVGLVPSAIYRHYRSKDSIIDAILDHVRCRLMTNVEKIYQETGDPLEQLQRLLFLHVRLIRENRSLPGVIFSGEIYAGHPGRKRKVYETISAYLDQVAGIVQKGKEQRIIRAEVNPSVVSVMFLGLIQPGAILWHMSDGEFDVTRQTMKAWQLFRDTIIMK